MRVFADNKTQLRVADPAVAYRNGRQNARLEWGSSNIYGFTYFCGVLPKKNHFLQVLAKKSAGVSWRGVLAPLVGGLPASPKTKKNKRTFFFNLRNFGALQRPPNVEKSQLVEF